MKIFYLVLRLLTVLFVLVVACCMMGSKISPIWFSYSSLCSLVFPYAYGALFLWGIAMLFVRWQNSIIVMVMLVIGYNAFSHFFVFPTFPSEGHVPVLRVMSWNVGSFSHKKNKYKTIKDIERTFFEVVDKTKPDVICLQETWIENKAENWLTLGAKNHGYPYVQYGKNSLITNKNVYYGSAIFSKYPIINKSHTVSSLRTQLVDVSIFHPIKKKPVHIFSIHLQSNKINAELIQELKELNMETKESLNAAITFSGKLSSNSRIRYNQIEEVLAICADIKEPSIFCIDLNDLAGSYNYHKLREERLDAFYQKGSWFRMTFPQGLTSVGIDFIFSDTSLPPLTYKQLSSDLSDHLPHYADF